VRVLRTGMGEEMSAYYNEIDPYAAQWLRNLIKAGHIADGEVDTRSIVDVRPDDIRGFTQAHFFAGIGGWSHALRLAGWPDDRPIWTGSCPCQPFSVAGKGAGVDDPRHLWPHFHRLITAVRPPVVMGEQVAGQAGYGWLDGVRADLEREGYASRGVDIPACSVDAPHIRQRLYWIAKDLADSKSQRRQSFSRSLHSNVEQQAGQLKDGNFFITSNGENLIDWVASNMDHTNNKRLERHSGDEDGGKRWSSKDGPIAPPSSGDMADPQQHSRGCQAKPACDKPQESDGPADQHGGRGSSPSFWSDHVWLTGADGKARRAQPGIPLLAHGIPNRVGKLRAYGNAIVPQVAAEVIGAYMDCAQAWGKKND